MRMSDVLLESRHNVMMVMLCYVSLWWCPLRGMSWWCRSSLWFMIAVPVVEPLARHWPPLFFHVSSCILGSCQRQRLFTLVNSSSRWTSIDIVFQKSYAMLWTGDHYCRNCEDAINNRLGTDNISHLRELIMSYYFSAESFVLQECQPKAASS